jgi:hypothetical protein
MRPYRLAGALVGRVGVNGQPVVGMDVYAASSPRRPEYEERSSRYGSTRISAIIPPSSWSRMWQWYTNLPAMENCIFTVTLG